MANYKKKCSPKHGVSTSPWKISSAICWKNSFSRCIRKDKTKDADNIILHDFLQCALNILVSTAFNTLKYILCEVYCLGLYLHELNDSEYTITDACTLPQDTRTACWFNLKASVSLLMISAIVTLICLIYDWNWRWVEAVWRKLIAYHEVCNQHHVYYVLWNLPTSPVLSLSVFRSKVKIISAAD